MSLNFKHIIKIILNMIILISNNILLFVMVNFYSYIILYFIYFFNLLYYKIQYYNLSIYILYYKIKKYKALKIIFYLYLWFNIIFFYFFYIQYVLKVLEIWFLKIYKIFNILNSYIFYILEMHYIFLSYVNILNYNRYKDINVHIHIVEQYILNWFFYNIFYLKFLFLDLYKQADYNYLWLYTRVVRFYRLIQSNKNNEKYKIKFIFKEYKKFIFLKIKQWKFNNAEALENKKFWKKKFYKKRAKTLKYWYTKCKRVFMKYYLNYKIEYQNSKNDRIEIVLFILYDIHSILVKHSGYLIFYYIFLIFKYIKSYILYIWKSDIIYNFLKKIERKKW